MKTILVKETEVTSGILQVVLSSIRAEQFNTVPFSGSWTAGQVAEHLLLSASGVLENLRGPVQPTERDPFEKAEPIRNMFLDLSTKMTTPDFVRPSDTPQDKEVLVHALEKEMSGIRAVAETEDLSVTCTCFEFPFFGNLTRFEWITFILAHVQRHTHQLNIIAEKLGAR